jgi:hypothetical protein
MLEQILTTLNVFTAEMWETRRELNDIRRDVLELQRQLAYRIDSTLPYKCITSTVAPSVIHACGADSSNLFFVICDLRSGHERANAILIKLVIKCCK